METLDQQTKCVIGIDLGGTKCAAGLILLPEGRILSRQLRPTEPARGGQAVLRDVIEIARSLQEEARRVDQPAAAIGIGVAELVDKRGDILSRATIDWQGIPIRDLIQSATNLRSVVDADVRAAARAEACLGVGRELDPFLYVTVGTGISACLVVNGIPYNGAHGLTGTFASSRTLILDDLGRRVAGPPLEEHASGAGLAARFARHQKGFVGTTKDVFALADAGNVFARVVMEDAGLLLGTAVAQLVNIVDPEVVVMGGGLGLAGGFHRRCLLEGLRNHVWSQHHRNIAVLDAELGVDAGWIGAALAAQGN